MSFVIDEPINIGVLFFQFSFFFFLTSFSLCFHLPPFIFFTFFIFSCLLFFPFYFSYFSSSFPVSNNVSFTINFFLPFSFLLPLSPLFHSLPPSLSLIFISFSLPSRSHLLFDLFQFILCPFQFYRLLNPIFFTLASPPCGERHFTDVARGTCSERTRSNYLLS